MPNKHNKLYLYEAIELRAEYDARIRTLKTCLPGRKQETQEHWMMQRDEPAFTRPHPEFDVARAREEIRGLEFKRRKINAAIQQANIVRTVDIDGEPTTLLEALEIRKGLNERIGELHNQLAGAAQQRVIYKEGRDIVEETDVAYGECAQDLDQARLQFRALNRTLRAATYETVVDFVDE